MGKKLVDNVLEEEIINQLVRQAQLEDDRDKKQLDRYNKRISELEIALQNNEWRDSVKRNQRTWLNMFKSQRKELINKHSIKYS
jgi:hypothetical protein